MEIAELELALSQHSYGVRNVRSPFFPVGIWAALAWMTPYGGIQLVRCNRCISDNDCGCGYA